MLKAYLKFDAYLIERINTIYLWLLDRTGVYVATIMFDAYVVAAATSLCRANGLPIWYWMIILAFIGLFLGPRYLMQDKGEVLRFNIASLVLEKWVGRHVINVILMSFLVLDLLRLEPFDGLIQIIFLLFGYLNIIKIRDREKKPLFEKQERMAMQESHGSN